MGKSVLLKMLMGLTKPDSGKILINNINLDDIKQRKHQNLRFSVFCVIEFFDRDYNVTLYSMKIILILKKIG